MANRTSFTELSNMQGADLEREITQQRIDVAKYRLAVKSGKEKNTAKYQRAKRQLARMQTALTKKRASELQSKKADSTVSAPSKS